MDFNEICCKLVLWTKEDSCLVLGMLEIVETHKTKTTKKYLRSRFFFS